MSDIDLNEIFLKNDDEVKIDIDSPVKTTDDRNEEVKLEPEHEPKPEPKKRGRKKGTISEEQREKMLLNLKRGREKKKRELLKKKQDKIEAENLTLKEIRELKAEIALLKSSRNNEKVEKPKVEKPKVEKLEQKVEPKKEEVVQVVKPPEPKVIYHGFNPNKRRY